MKKRRPSFHNEGRLTKNFFLIPHGVREFLSFHPKMRISQFGHSQPSECHQMQMQFR